MSPIAQSAIQKEIQGKGVRMEIRFADAKGKMRKYIGPARSYKGHSNPFGRALEELKHEALNWFVGETLYAAEVALKTLMFYLGDLTAELLKYRIGIYGDASTPVHVYTGSMIESIAPKPDNVGVTKRTRSVAWSTAIGIMEGATRMERSGLPVPSPKNTGEFVANYAYSKLDLLYTSQEISGEVTRELQEATLLWSAAGVDASAWASIGASYLSSRIQELRGANYQKILASAEERIQAGISRAKGGNTI